MVCCWLISVILFVYFVYFLFVARAQARWFLLFIFIHVSSKYTNLMVDLIYCTSWNIRTFLSYVCFPFFQLHMIHVWKDDYFFSSLFYCLWICEQMQLHLHVMIFVWFFFHIVFTNSFVVFYLLADYIVVCCPILFTLAFFFVNRFN